MTWIPEARLRDIFEEGVFPDYSEILKLVKVFDPDRKMFCAPMDVKLDGDEYTMIQPDILIVCNRDKIKDHIVGAPDLVIEILSPGTRKKDMTIKLNKYRKAGILEYWMVDLEKECVIAYFFGENENPVIYGAEAKVPVKIYDGNLKIDFSEIFAEIRDF